MIQLFIMLFGKKSPGTPAASEQIKFDSILNSLQDAVIVYDKNFKVSIFNSSAERIFKVPASEVVGHVISPDKVSVPKYTLLIQTLFPSLAPVVNKKTEAGVYPQVVDITFPEQNLELGTSTAPIVRGDENSGFIKVITDRTKEMDAQKSKSEFIHMAAHRLRTPLTVASWALDALRKSESLQGEDKNAAEEGYAASQKLSKIIADLLDVEKIEAGSYAYKFKDLDIVAFLSEALANAQNYIKENKLGINIYMEKGPEEAILVNADPENLGKAISNILDNAIKYNIKNGSITAIVAKLPDRPFVKVSIKDTGIGIPEERTSQVSEKFFRADNAKAIEADASGLGLFIARAIIARHGGVLKIESVLGRGTTVSFTLPLDHKIVPRSEFGSAASN